MDQIEKARSFAKEFIENNPKHKRTVLDFLQLLEYEIESGGDPQNELNIFQTACEGLLKGAGSSGDKG